jgi:undecaprenyl diphosphate synthase
MGVSIGYLIGRRYATKSTIPSNNNNRTNWKEIQSTITPTLRSRWMTSINIYLGYIAQYCAIVKRCIYSFFQQLLNISTIYQSSYQSNKYSYANAIPSVNDCDPNNVSNKEREARIQLKSDDETKCESGLELHEIPYHIAVVMDGNRRYGMQQYNNPLLGHWDGSKKLLQFVKWCLAEHIKELTVYALSTENWSRDTNEIASLMNIIVKYCEELRIEAIEKKISIHIHSTDPDSIPSHVREVLQELENETYLDHPTLRMNICLSYGSRGEIVNACRSIVADYVQQCTTNDSTTICKQSLSEINEDMITRKLLLCHRPPDICIRTSGEVRLSNFLLWQMAYTELFFIERHWPELQKDDLLQILRSYAYNRQRRFGR